jgi:hypothetical protein
MSELTFLFNKSNPYGISKDIEGMTASLEMHLSQYASGCRYADPLEVPFKTNILIHVELPIYAWMPWAAKNILVVNPEWFQEAWLPYMHRFAAVIYKDPLSAEEAIRKGYVTREQVHVVPWGCAKPEPPKTKNQVTPKGTVDTGFVWFLAGSTSKRAYVPKILSMWRETYPPLRIYSVDPIDLSGLSVPPNIRFEAKDLDPNMKAGLSTFFRGHVACSIAEGFSYAAAEAEWYGAYTILNELNCYVSDYKDCSGVHMIYTAAAVLEEPLAAAIHTFETADLDALALKRKNSAAERYKRFLKGFSDVVQRIATQESASMTLPPILLPEDCPPISIVTMLYNRRKFFDLACHNITMTDYPKNKIEWIIIEDSDNPMEDASDRVMAVAKSAAPVRVVYVPLRKKLPVSEKRNMAISTASEDIVLMMDDDDHYPETSFRRRVAWLTKHPWKPRCTTATTIACYDLVKGISAVNTPPLGLPLGQRVSEATLTFYKSWWTEKGFPTDVQVGEGESFLAGREGDVLEIPPQQIIVAFSHGANTSSRRIPSGAEVKPGCFWGFPKEFLVFIHGLAGVKVVEES